MVSLFVFSCFYCCLVTNSAVADVSAVCFPWVPAVEIVSAAAGGPASVVVLTAVAFVSAVAVDPTAVDILSTTGVSNVSGVPAVVGVLAFDGFYNLDKIRSVNVVSTSYSVPAVGVP